jgi:hypothetical protein
MPRHPDPWSLPYGCYLTRDSAVLFDRRYQPIVRFLPGEVVIACDPRERIEHDGRVYHYSDANPARYNAQTLKRLRLLVAAIPQLAAEIKRRA